MKVSLSSSVGDGVEPSPFGQVLADAAVEVFVGAALPRRARDREVGGHCGGVGQFVVPCEFEPVSAVIDFTACAGKALIIAC